MANQIRSKKGVRQDGVPSDDQDSDGLVGESFWKRIGVTLILVPLFAFVLRPYWIPSTPQTDAQSRIDNVLKSLLKQEKNAFVTPNIRVVVGYGACLDLFVDAKDLFSQYTPPEVTSHTSQIRTKSELLESFAYFFSHGAAAERFVSGDEQAETLFDDLVKYATTSIDHRTALGGNAPVIANRLAMEGADVILAGRMSKILKDKIRPGITLTGQADQSSGNAIDTKDDVHLILEYKRNEEWGKYKSPRANRFIIHNDKQNPTVSSLEDLDETLKHSQHPPNLFVVSGLQMMDNYPFMPGERLSRVQQIQRQMKEQNEETTRIHFEMASFVDKSLLQELTSLVVPHADSLGMNEQELPNLHSMLLHGNVSVVSDSNPRTAVVLDQMREVYNLLGEASDANPDRRRLTRLHVHTLAYQVILVERKSAWKNTRIAAVKSSLTANRHVCASIDVNPKKAFVLMDDSFSISANPMERKETIVKSFSMGEGEENDKTYEKYGSRVPFNENRPVACWLEMLQGEREVEICLAPNLVCSEAKQTAGGGDNISASGLIVQL